MFETKDFFILIVGAFVGVLSSYFSTVVFNQRNTINQKLLEQYFLMREKIASIISVLTTLNPRDEVKDEDRKKIQEDLYKVTYENYDFLPKEVLDALITLYVCLERNRGELYIVNEKKITVIEDHNKIKEFIDEASFYDTGKISAIMALKSKNLNIRQSQAVSLHARYVFIKMNEYSSVDKLIEVSKKFRKKERLF